MATACGKKARKRGGTRFACKRARARKSKNRTWGKLRYSAAANNLGGLFATIEDLSEKVRAARQAKTGDPEANVAVEV